MYGSRPVTIRRAAGERTERPASWPATGSTVLRGRRWRRRSTGSPVQRQRLPLSRRAVSSSSASSPSPATVVTSPAVQNPHWNAAASTNALLHRVQPRGAEPGDRGDRPARRPVRRGPGRSGSGRPSSSTVHAPQSPESQPFFTSTCPCSRSSVRRHLPGRGLGVDGRAVHLEPHAQLLPHLLGEPQRHGPAPVRARRAGRRTSRRPRRPRRAARRRSAAVGNARRCGCVTPAVRVTTSPPASSRRPTTIAPDRPCRVSATRRNAAGCASTVGGHLARTGAPRPGAARWSAPR